MCICEHRESVPCVCMYVCAQGVCTVCMCVHKESVPCVCVCTKSVCTMVSVCVHSGVCMCVHNSLCMCAGEGKDDPYSEPNEKHMLEFSLKVKCRHNPKAPKDSEDPNKLYVHSQGGCVLWCLGEGLEVVLCVCVC